MDRSSALTTEYATTGEKNPRRSPVRRWLLVAWASLVMLGVVLGAIVHMAFRDDQAERVQADAQIVARLAADNVALWIDQRVSDARVMVENTGYTIRVRDYFIDPANEVNTEAVVSRLLGEHRYRGFSYLQLFDPSGTFRLGVPDSRTDDPADRAAVTRAFATPGYIETGRARRAPDGRVEVPITAALGAPGPDGEVVYAVCVFYADLSAHVFPLLARWPGVTRTGEVLLALIQPHASSENDMPMRLYGVIPVLVEDPQTRISPVLKMPDDLEPLQQFKVEVSEKSRREMTYTLAIVEEGLLDLTRFKTPDPWSLFYAREALGVRSWDLYDMVIGAYGGKLTSILGIGGDDEQAGGQSAEKANRFKPVVKYLGPFTLKAGKTNSHTLVMPNYIGSVRAMVVAGIDGAYGFAEKTIPVKKPLMVLATLPRVLGTGESVKLPVTVFAMDDQIKQVSVSVKTNEYLIAEGGTSQPLTFTQTGDKMVEFEFKTARKTGIGKVQVTATSGRNTAVYDIELDIRNANPPVTTFTGNTVEAGKTEEINFTLPGMENTNTAVLEVSGIPPIDAERRLRYLINYPHGCIEQITSTVFAQLFLTDLVELDENSKSDIERNIKAGINKLQRFQVAGGGLAYWPGNLVPDPWGSSYAGHFLIEAEKKGYALPSGMKSSWLKSQKQFARQWSPIQYRDDSYRQDDLEQAYRLFTLALAKEPEMAAMNRLREVKNLSLQAKWRLAAAYALAGQMQVAKELVSRESTEIQPYTGLYSSYGSRERDLAMLLETMALMNNQTQGAILTRRISESLSSASWMSTQTTAYCLLAVAKFATGSATDKLNFSYKLANGKTINVVSSKPLTQVRLSLPRNAKTLPLTINNSGKAILFTRIIMEGIPESGEEKEFSNNLNISIAYQTRDGKPVDVSRVAQGTDFLAVVSVYNPGAFRYRQMALTQIFPPGWEIRNNRLADAAVSENISNPEYQDIRDDRIYTYFDLARGERKTFVVQLNAAYLGRYYLPGTYCEAMYDNSISALKKGQWVEVVNAD
ncbi:MAG: alpha-2-macroglobulin family protein [Bacteroidales bacterium]